MAELTLTEGIKSELFFFFVKRAHPFQKLL